MWVIEYYEMESGKKPVEEFLENLEFKLKVRAFREINSLKQLGNLLQMPFSKPIKDGIFELRVQIGGNAARIFYFFQYGNKIVLTNGFVKKTQKTPNSEIEKAIKYKQDYERRHK